MRWRWCWTCALLERWDLDTLRLRQNGRHYPDNIFKYIFLNENVWISNRIWLKFVPKGPIDNNPALDKIMAWHRSGDKPLSEPMMVRSLTHICVTQPQWVNPEYVYKAVWMRVCMDEWVDGSMNVWMDRWIFGCVKDAWYMMAEQKDGQTKINSV